MANTSQLILTRDNIIAAALRRLGVLGEGETASPNQVTEAAQALNVIIKQFDTAPWVKYLIKSAEQTIATVNATASYDLAADDLWVESMSVEIATNIDKPLKMITVGDYAQIIDKARPGIPEYAFVTDDLDVPAGTIPDQKVYLWPVPNAVMNINYISRRKVKVFGASTDYLDLPDAWTRFIILQLAADLAYEYGLDLNKISLLHQTAEAALNFAKQDQVKQIDGQEVMNPSVELNSPDEVVRTKRVSPTEAQ